MNDGDIELKGKKATYVMNGGSNAMCRLEELTGGDKSFLEVLQELSKPMPRITLVRTFMQAVLVQPENVTAEEAGRIIDDIGGITVLADSVMQAAAARETHEPPARKGKQREAA